MLELRLRLNCTNFCPFVQFLETSKAISSELATGTHIRDLDVESSLETNPRLSR